MQHVFQVVECVLSAVRLHGTQYTLHNLKHMLHNTAELITMYFYWLILHEWNFSWAHRKLSEDGPGRPKHVGVNIRHFNVNFNILKKEFWRYVS